MPIVSVIDPHEVARRAGLVHVDVRTLPIVRRRCGSGFSYVGPDARVVRGPERARIDALAIPPAWRQVRVAADDRCHVQAVGVDDEGRTQYRYHEAFRAAADEAKFARLGELGEALPRLRRAVRDRLRACGDDADGTSDIAAVIALIDATSMRVGSERYAETNESFGATTLRRRHVTRTDRGLRFVFTAKAGIERDLILSDPDIVEPIWRCHVRGTGADDRLFRGPEGGIVSGDTVARWLTTWSGIEMTAKELRTWGATATMVVRLMDPDPTPTAASDDPVLAAYDGVAERLGNTRDVARSSYVAPRVVEAHESGELAALWRGSRSSALFTRGEQCCRKLFAT